MQRRVLLDAHPPCVAWVVRGLGRDGLLKVRVGEATVRLPLAALLDEPDAEDTAPEARNGAAPLPGADTGFG